MVRDPEGYRRVCEDNVRWEEYTVCAKALEATIETKKNRKVM